MTPDATGDRTQDAQDTLRPAFPTPTPRAASPADLSATAPAGQVTGHRSAETQQDTDLSAGQVDPPVRQVATPRPAQEDEQDTKEPNLWQQVKLSWSTRRAEKAARVAVRQQDADATRAMADAAQAAADAERDRQREALSRTAAASRRAGGRPVSRETRAEQIAPIPPKMRVLGVWLDRTIGTTPLLAPLIVSGYFTVHVFTDAPLSVPLLIALAITAALEGGVWKLSRIYEATLLEGDSTLGIRVAIGLYLALISGMIYGHAYYSAWLDAKRDAGDGDVVVVVDWSKWAPAAGVAMMSALGVLVWSKQARYLHRVALRAAGQIDPRAPKFATLAWVLHPSETTRALRHSVKYRISSPIEATADLRLYVAVGRPPIWPIPPGFSWINGKLFQTAPVTGRHDDDEQDAGQQPTGHPRQVAGPTGQRLTGKPTAGGRTPDDRAQDADRSPTTGHHGSQVTPADHGSHGSHADNNRSPVRADDRSQDTSRSQDADGSPDDTGAFADILKYSEHLVAVTDAHSDWMTVTPSIRKINAAVDQARQRRRGKRYNANETSKLVQVALVKLRERPEMLDLMRVQQEGMTS